MLWTWQGQGQQRSESWGRKKDLTVGGFLQFKERCGIDLDVPMMPLESSQKAELLSLGD